MQKIRLIAILFLYVAVFCGGFYTGYQWAQPTAEQKLVTADVILTSLHDRGFLVTRTYVFTEPVTIKITEGSVWKDLLFGQTIQARGNMEVNLGVDLQKVSAADIEIDSRRITVTLPPAEIFNSRLVGPIDVDNRQGVLKRLLDRDDGYNQALAELTAQAEAAAKSKNLLQEANEQAIAEVARLLGLVVEEQVVEVIITPVDDGAEPEKQPDVKIDESAAAKPVEPIADAPASNDLSAPPVQRGASPDALSAPPGEQNI